MCALFLLSLGNSLKFMNAAGIKRSINQSEQQDAQHTNLNQHETSWIQLLLTVPSVNLLQHCQILEIKHQRIAEKKTFD